MVMNPSVYVNVGGGIFLIGWVKFLAIKYFMEKN